jgi:hypothetical protein
MSIILHYIEDLYVSGDLVEDWKYEVRVAYWIGMICEFMSFHHDKSTLTSKEGKILQLQILNDCEG